MKKRNYFVTILACGLLSGAVMADPLDILSEQQLIVSSLASDQNGLLLGAKLNRYAARRGLYWMNFNDSAADQTVVAEPEVKQSEEQQRQSSATIRYGILDIPIIK